MVVEIPVIEQHCGSASYLGRYWINDYCPKCGAARGVKRWHGFSFDGSRRLVVDCWQNECGHIDLYSEIRKEGVLVIMHCAVCSRHINPSVEEPKTAPVNDDGAIDWSMGRSYAWHWVCIRCFDEAADSLFTRGRQKEDV